MRLGAYANLQTTLKSFYGTEQSLRNREQILHYENTHIQIYCKFYHQKLKVFRKNSDLFHNPAQNIDCGYSFEAVLTSTHNLCF